MATCPECEFDEIDTEDFEDDDTVSCPECGKTLVVTGGELDLADEDDDEKDEEKGEDDVDEDVLDEDEDEEETDVDE